MSYQTSLDPSGLYYGSNASGLVNVAADNIHINADVNADSVFCENLTVTGQTVVQNLTELTITNPIIEIASSNTVTDKLLTGILAEYGTSAGSKFAGLVRLPAAGKGQFLLVKDGSDITMTDSVDADLGLNTLTSSTIRNNGVIHTTDIKTATIEIIGNSGTTDSNTTTITQDAVTSYTINATDITTSTLEITTDLTVPTLKTDTIEPDTGLSITQSTTIFNGNISSPSIDVSGTSNQNIIQCRQIEVYPSIPFDTQITESDVPTLLVNGNGVETLGITAANIVGLSVTTTTNPAELVPLLGNLTSALVPYASMSLTGNVTAYGYGGVGGNMTASGLITGNALNVVSATITDNLTSTGTIATLENAEIKMGIVDETQITMNGLSLMMYPTNVLCSSTGTNTINADSYYLTSTTLADLTAPTMNLTASTKGSLIGNWNVSGPEISITSDIVTIKGGPVTITTSESTITSDIFNVVSATSASIEAPDTTFTGNVVITNDLTTQPASTVILNGIVSLGDADTTVSVLGVLECNDGILLSGISALGRSIYSETDITLTANVIYIGSDLPAPTVTNFRGNNNLGGEGTSITSTNITLGDPINTLTNNIKGVEISIGNPDSSTTTTTLTSEKVYITGQIDTSIQATTGTLTLSAPDPAGKIDIISETIYIGEPATNGTLEGTWNIIGPESNIKSVIINNGDLVDTTNNNIQGIDIAIGNSDLTTVSSSISAEKISLDGTVSTTLTGAEYNNNSVLINSGTLTTTTKNNIQGIDIAIGNSDLTTLTSSITAEKISLNGSVSTSLIGAEFNNDSVLLTSGSMVDTTKNSIQGIDISIGNSDLTTAKVSINAIDIYTSGIYSQTGESTFTGAVNVTGILTAEGALVAEGEANVTGVLTAEGDCNVVGALTAEGILNVAGLLTAEAECNVVGALTAEGICNVAGLLTAEGAMNVVGLLSAQGALGVVGISTMTGIINANGGVQCNGIANVTGLLTAEGDANVVGLLTAEGEANVSGLLTCEGAATVVGLLTCGSFICLDNSIKNIAETAANDVLSNLPNALASATTSTAATAGGVVGGILGGAFGLLGGAISGGGSSSTYTFSQPANTIVFTNTSGNGLTTDKNYTYTAASEQLLVTNILAQNVTIDNNLTTKTCNVTSDFTAQDFHIKAPYSLTSSTSSTDTSSNITTTTATSINYSESLSFGSNFGYQPGYNTITTTTVGTNASTNTTTYTGGLITLNDSVQTSYLTVNNNARINGTDFALGSSSTGRGSGGRALVQDAGNQLHINYAGDFGGGILLDGPSVTVSNNLTTQTCDVTGSFTAQDFHIKAPYSSTSSTSATDTTSNITTTTATSINYSESLSFGSNYGYQPAYDTIVTTTVGTNASTSTTTSTAGLINLNDNTYVGGSLSYSSVINSPQLNNGGTQFDPYGNIFLPNAVNSNYWVIGTNSDKPSLQIYPTLHKVKTYNNTIDDGVGNGIVNGNLSCKSLTVNGTQQTITGTNIQLEQGVIELLQGNSADTQVSGFAAQYIPSGSSTTQYSGIVRMPASAGSNEYPGQLVCFQSASDPGVSNSTTNWAFTLEDMALRSLNMGGVLNGPSGNSNFEINGLGDQTGYCVQIKNGPALALNTYSGQLYSQNNTLDNGYGDMNVAGNFTMSNNALYTSSNATSYTKHNTLDDGSGNMVIAGGLNINGAAKQFLSTLASLNDVAESNLQSGDVLTYNGTNWVNQPTQNDITIIAGNPSIVQYYEIATLVASNNATFDSITIEMSCGEWMGQRCEATFHFGNRGSFGYNYKTEGNLTYFYKCPVSAYSQADGSVNIYQSFVAGQYTVSNYTIVNNEQEKVYTTPILLTTTPPPGTLVFDSSSSNYPPEFSIDLIGNLVTRGGINLSGVGKQFLSTIASLADVTITTPSSNQVLTYNGTDWVNQGLPSTTPNSSYYLSGLGDVSESNLISGQILTYNGTKWVNTATPAPPNNDYYSLAGLKDVAITTATTNQVLTFNGTDWVNQALSFTYPANNSTTSGLLIGTAPSTTSSTAAVGGLIVNAPTGSTLPPLQILNNGIQCLHVDNNNVVSTTHNTLDNGSGAFTAEASIFTYGTIKTTRCTLDDGSGNSVISGSLDANGGIGIPYGQAITTGTQYAGGQNQYMDAQSLNGIDTLCLYVPGSNNPNTAPIAHVTIDSNGKTTINGNATITGTIQTYGTATIGNDVIVQGTDFTLGSSGTGRGNGGRALVQQTNNTLYVNYSDDFGGGIVLDGQAGVHVTGAMTCALFQGGVGGGASSYTDNYFNIYLPNLSTATWNVYNSSGTSMLQVSQNGVSIPDLLVNINTSPTNPMVNQASSSGGIAAMLLPGFNCFNPPVSTASTSSMTSFYLALPSNALAGTQIYLAIIGGNSTSVGVVVPSGGQMWGGNGQYASAGSNIPQGNNYVGQYICSGSNNWFKIGG